MVNSNINEWLITNQGFRRKYNSLLIASVANQFSEEFSSSDDEEKIDWHYLLLCASLLAQSSKEGCQQIALRIAHFCLESVKTNSTEKDAAAIILDSLGNLPAIKLAESRKLLSQDFSRRLSFSQFQNWIKRSIQNTIFTNSGKFIQANRFQRGFWEAANQNDWLSVSAPTSAGKSFILEQWISHYVHQENNPTIVYLVPTRALISQVQSEIELLLKNNGNDNFAITTLPINSSIASDSANILILTQERFHIFLSESSKNIDALIVDEAHKIGDNYRGILLQHALDITVLRNPRCKVIFASPMTINPEELLSDSPNGAKVSSLLSENVTVNQNLFWITQLYGKPKEWQIDLVNESETHEIGKIKLSFSPTDICKRVTFIAHKLSGSSGGNVIYANGPADAEKFALQLFGLTKEVEEKSSLEEINNLSDLIRKTIHKDYQLSKTIKHGIAFHYGNMPQLVRNEIESLFSKGTIKFLICTSTLLEGINMPCRNLFVRGPTKGRGKPMNETDFWNLAGRAGRWGKEFQGNVFCIDTQLGDVWKNGAPHQRKKYAIERSIDRVFGDYKFIDYLKEKAPNEISLENPSFEYAISFLAATYIINNGISNTIWAKRFDPSQISFFDNCIENLLSNEIKIPRDVILRNPGINPLSMQRLFSYFVKRTNEEKKPIDELLPISPTTPGDAPFNSYVKVLHRVNKHFGNIFGVPSRVKQLALLIVDWMKGFPLARIISSRESYYKKKNKTFKLPSLIRETMADVEEFARFQAPKYLACYMNVLDFFLHQENRHDLAKELLDLHVFLEFGVSQKTQLALIGIGLSRSSSILVSELIASDSLSEKEAVKWLKQNEWMTADMPELIKKEIAEVLKRQ